MGFNSKYTGQEIEDLLDKVSEGKVDSYIVKDFSVQTLIANAGVTINTAVSIDFIDAIKNGSKIYIPYEMNASNGYYTLNGHIKDSVLNFSILVDDCKVLYCKNNAINESLPSINGINLVLVNIDNLQEKLVSGKNISTINGKSLLSGEDLDLGQKYYEVSTSGTLAKSATVAIKWNANHIVPTPISHLYITNYNHTAPTDTYAETSIVFKLSNTGGNFVLFDNNYQTNPNITWMNGVDPIPSLKAGIVYELSITAVKIDKITQYNCILAPFYK